MKAKNAYFTVISELQQLKLSIPMVTRKSPVTGYISSVLFIPRKFILRQLVRVDPCYSLYCNVFILHDRPDHHRDLILMMNGVSNIPHVYSYQESSM
jgi:hypothetical protein